MGLVVIDDMTKIVGKKKKKQWGDVGFIRTIKNNGESQNTHGWDLCVKKCKRIKGIH